MKLTGYYTSGEFARMAHISVRTIRFYDKQNILKPSHVNESGARFYSEEDFARLQQILLLKYLGFSLEDIKDMTINDSDSHMLLSSLNMQLKLIRDRIEQLHMVENAIQDTSFAIQSNQHVDWNKMLDLIHLTNIERSLKSQYQDASNISARIQLHKLYSVNKQGWFPWLFEQAHPISNTRVLEIGCGNGAFWSENLEYIPTDITILLSDISEGMLRDAKRNIGQKDLRFSFSPFDCHQIPHPDNSFDMVLANHVLFYCTSIQQVLSEIRRILKPHGRFVCSTYGIGHMKEISQLVSDFDDRILLSGEKLYSHFGLENGYEILKPYFHSIHSQRYEDNLFVDSPEPLIEYILSCHGNQNQYILDHYKEFRTFVETKTNAGFYITKEAGIFICE